MEEKVKQILEDNIRLFPWRVKLDKDSALIDFRIFRAIKEGKASYIDQSYVLMLLRLEDLLEENLALALTSSCEYTRTFAGFLVSRNKENQREKE